MILRKKFYLSFLISLFGSSIVFFLIHYFSYKYDSASDLSNYIENFTRFKYIVFYDPRFLFYAIYFFITTLTLNPVFSLQIISTLSISLIINTIIIASNQNKYFVLLLLFHPRFIDLIVSQTRSALALAFFISAVFLNIDKIYKYFVFLLSIIMHYSMAPLFLIFYLVERYRSKPLQINSIFSMEYKSLSFKRKFNLIFGNLLFILLALIANVLNLRGGNVASSTTFVYSGMWLITALITFWIFDYSLKRFSIENYLLILLITVAPVLNTLGYESTRLYGYAIPFACISISKLSGLSMRILFLTYLFNNAYSLYKWLQFI